MGVGVARVVRLAARGATWESAVAAADEECDRSHTQCTCKSCRPPRPACPCAHASLRTRSDSKSRAQYRPRERCGILSSGWLAVAAMELAAAAQAAAEVGSPTWTMQRLMKVLLAAARAQRTEVLRARPVGAMARLMALSMASGGLAQLMRLPGAMTEAEANRSANLQEVATPLPSSSRRLLTVAELELDRRARGSSAS